jgi:alpha-tubulin suppressor-like RCC1 family protein
VTDLEDAAELACGRQHCCARTSSGSVRCWGAGGSGQLAGKDNGDAFRAAPVEGLEGVSTIALGDDFGCAVAAGAVRCWGNNRFGQLGSANPDDQLVELSGPSGVSVVSAGARYACALSAASGLYCWGALAGPAPAQSAAKPLAW